MCLVTWYGFVFCSIPKHRIGTKRHRVCLEVPQEVSESEAFPKEELSSAQYEADMAESRERPTSELVQQGEQKLKLPGNCVSSFILVRGIILQGAESGALFHMRLAGRMLSCPKKQMLVCQSRGKHFRNLLPWDLRYYHLIIFLLLLFFFQDQHVHLEQF